MSLPIRPGDCVKIRRGSESLWCDVLAVRGRWITARVSDEPCGTARHGLARGDDVLLDVDDVLAYAPRAEP